MKSFLRILIILFFSYSAGYSQAARGCGTLPRTTSSATGCLVNPYDYYFFDTTKVYVNIYYLTPGGAGGVYDNLTSATSVAVIDSINRMFDSLYAPNLIIYPPAPYVRRPNIKFVLKNTQQVTNSYVYYNSPVWNTILPDPNAINMIFGASNVKFGYGITSDTPGKEIFHIDSAGTPSTAYITSAGTIGLLLHELTHALGLAHTDTLKVDANYYADMGVDDYFPEDSTIFGKSAPCGVTSKSNNIMGYNWDCRHYLSPKQIGLMHYYINSNEIAGVTNRCQYNAAKSITIASTQTWTMSRLMTGDLIVKSGNALTVKCVLAFPKGGKVVIERGAQLIVDGGHLTNLCSELWDGVEVAGNPLQDQTLNASTGFAANQGVLRVINGGTISNSGNAVRNYTTNASHLIDWNSMGGIIRADQANFVNNTRDVEFITYPYFNSVSMFTGCSFVTNAVINGGQLPFTHVSLWGIRGVKFYGCDFGFDAQSLYTGVGYAGMGIFSMDASYLVDQLCTGPCAPNTFRYLKTGVNVLNANPLNPVTVTNSSFNFVNGDAIHFLNMNSFTCDNNTIYGPLGGNGVYLHSCKYYTVKNNTIGQSGNFHTGSGMIIYNSQRGAHQVYRNFISGLNTGINCVDDNAGDTNTVDGLKLNCNNFSANYNNYDVLQLTGNTSNSTVKKFQGNISAAPSPTTLVRNLYNAPCGNNTKWFVSRHCTQLVNHGCNSTPANTQPLPQNMLPACSSTLINVVIQPQALTYSIHCPTNIPSNGDGGTPGQRLVHLNSYLDTLARYGNDPFEVQASIASKLNIFLRDSLPASQDSVVSILGSNPGKMADADIQLVFAYMNQQDYTRATAAANALHSSRADWKALLLELITIYQDPNKIYSLTTNSGYKDFMMDYATAQGRDGQYVAQALLTFVCGMAFDEPRPLPEEEGDARMAPAASGGALSAGAARYFEVYPNPAQNGITLYNSRPGKEETLQVELKDLLGKVIFTKFMSGQQELYIPLNEYNSGVYVLSLSKGKQVLYVKKIIKQN